MRGRSARQRLGIMLHGREMPEISHRPLSGNTGRRQLEMGVSPHYALALHHCSRLDEHLMATIPTYEHAMTHTLAGNRMHSIAYIFHTA